MTYHEELMVHPPKMAEMAGGVVEAEGHGTPVTSPDGIGTVASGLAALEAETEE